MTEVAPGIFVADGEMEESFIRASGPGGQNVNKVSTAVQLRFDIRGAPGIPWEVKARLEKLAGQRLTNDGVIVLTAQRFRSQERNREDARESLFALIRKAAVAPVRRRKTKPTYGAQMRRLESKAKRASVKQGRGRPDAE